MTEYLYHVTFLDNLDSIAGYGLEPGSGSVFGGGYTGHSQGRLFFTEAAGVPFWMSRYEELAEYHRDDPIEDRFIPVVLRVDSEYLGELHEDAAGTRDANAEAYYLEGEGVDDPSVIDVYAGDQWVPIEEAEADEMWDEVLQDADVIEEDGATWREAGKPLDEYFAPNL